MDETGFRIGIAGAERVIVPRIAKELYTLSPENRQTVTIVKTVSAVGGTIPPVLIIPASGQLQELDLQVLQQQFEEQKKGKGKSRARLQIGGQLTAEKAYKLRATKAEDLAQKALAKEAKIAREAASQARKKLNRLGVIAREQERLRKKRVKALLRARSWEPADLE
ncbi:hypothetical protein V501_10366 [Pseudogymnoascus sp. VKM F-4519 (FW-2642)]|nr:hypothetical protein V501_10366 [Pseudogymnoascus sp. VKM F-4519 (FW-2642)]